MCVFLDYYYFVEDEICLFCVDVECDGFLLVIIVKDCVCFVGYYGVMDELIECIYVLDVEMKFDDLVVLGFIVE